MPHLVIAGGGFAGFWGALSAVRQVAELGRRPELRITLVNRDAYHGIRPRFYESEIASARAPLEHWLTPLGIRLVVGEIHKGQAVSRHLHLADGRVIGYDALILATGSHLSAPDVFGAGGVFDVDTYAGAGALDRHLRTLADGGFPTQASRTVAVIGAGLTGLEVATALPGRLRALAPESPGFTVHLIDRAPEIGLGYERKARHYIRDRLRRLGVVVHAGQEVVRHEGCRLVLEGGAVVPAATIILATGLRASPLASAVSGPRDALGRLAVDGFLRLPEHPEVLAAGDVSWARTEANRSALMSCQHAIPQGKFAGHNAVNFLFGRDLVPYTQPRYNTCLDLGPGDALATVGWERRLKSIGPDAKALKTEILTRWIHPPVALDEALALAWPPLDRRSGAPDLAG